MIKIFNKLGLEGKCFNIIGVIHEDPRDNTVSSGEKLKAFPLRSGTSQRHPLLSLLFNIVLEVLAKVGHKKL
jgi:hypothetical protein